MKDKLNDSIPESTLIKTLCIHNKRHIQEIDHLQKMVYMQKNQIRQLRDHITRLRQGGKLQSGDRIPDIEELDLPESVKQFIHEALKGTLPTDKKLLKELKRDQYLANMRNQMKAVNKRYSELNKKYRKLRDMYVALVLKSREHAAPDER